MAAIALLGYAGNVVVIQKANIETIRIDAGRPALVVKPAEVAVIGPNNERGFWLEKGVGRGWAGEAVGHAQYHVWVPQSGRYRLWAYAMWHDVCTNAVYCSVDQEPPFIVGNDPLFGEWHWVHGGVVQLESGTHTLTLSNHSDFVGVLEIALIPESTGSPEEFEARAVSLFYDDFDGCDGGNFEQWESITGHWALKRDERAADPAGGILVGEAHLHGLFQLKKDWGESYEARFRLRCIKIDGNGWRAGMVLGTLDNGIAFGIEVADGHAIPHFVIEQYKQGKTVVLKRQALDFDATEWRELSISVVDDHVVVTVGGFPSFTVPVECRIRNDMGLVVEKGTAAFDAISVRLMPGNTSQE